MNFTVAAPGSLSASLLDVNLNQQQRLFFSVGEWDPWNFGADPYLWLMDPDPDATLDPTLFFSDFKDAKKIIFFV